MRLTKRELQVQELLREGLSVEAVAERLGITVQTARKYERFIVIAEMDAKHRANLAAAAAREEQEK